MLYERTLGKDLLELTLDSVLILSIKLLLAFNLNLFYFY